MDEIYVQAASGINFNNGTFSIYFVGQNQQEAAAGKFAERDEDLELKQVVHMPAAGFLYMVSMVRNLLEDERLAEQLQKMVDAGLIPSADAKVEAAPSKKEPKASK